MAYLFLGFGYMAALSIAQIAHSPVSGHSVQQLFQEPRNFISNSIFRHQPALLESLAEPEQHAYDEYQDDIPFEGIAYFAHLNNTNCFSASNDGTFDIGIVGAPFDLGVTYRPGARFGPSGARMGSRRLAPAMGYRYIMDNFASRTYTS
jgi:agmatinase